MADMKESERQSALLKRLAVRKLEGSHRGQEHEALKCALDECMQLEVETMAALAENDLLRGLLAKGEKDCVYCGLPAADISKCRSGFPGCARMDDIMDASR